MALKSSHLSRWYHRVPLECNIEIIKRFDIGLNSHGTAAADGVSINSMPSYDTHSETNREFLRVTMKPANFVESKNVNSIIYHLSSGSNKLV